MMSFTTKEETTGKDFTCTKSKAELFGSAF